MRLREKNAAGAAKEVFVMTEEKTSYEGGSRGFIQAALDMHGMDSVDEAVDMLFTSSVAMDGSHAGRMLAEKREELAEELGPEVPILWCARTILEEEAKPALEDFAGCGVRFESKPIRPCLDAASADAVRRRVAEKRREDPTYDVFADEGLPYPARCVLFGTDKSLGDPCSMGTFWMPEDTYEKAYAAFFRGLFPSEEEGALESAVDAVMAAGAASGMGDAGRMLGLKFRASGASVAECAKLVLGETVKNDLC